MIFVKINFTPKKIIDFKKSRTATEIALLDKDNYLYVTISCIVVMRKRVICILFRRLFFIAYLSKKLCIFSNFVQLIMKV